MEDSNSTFVLFRGEKRISVKEDDMHADKLCRIFQVNKQSLYITDDDNVAIFPEESGQFVTVGLVHRGHYQVHGEQEQRSAQNSVQPPAAAPFLFMHRPSSSAAPQPSPAVPQARRMFPARSFQRSIHVAEIVNNRVNTSSTVIIRFNDDEATVDGITAKVKEALQTDGSFILVDSQGNEILDSEATRSTQYWKQNSRKFYVILEEAFLDYQNFKRNKLSRRSEDSSSLNDIQDKINQLKEAAEGLQDITSSMNQLSELAKRNNTTMLTDTCIQSAQEAFSCLVCKGVMVEPMFATCCECLVGCKMCVELWLQSSDHCLKCRTEAFHLKAHQIKGLSAFLSALKEMQT